MATEIKTVEGVTDEPSVSINGVQSKISDLDAQQKYYVAQIQDLETQEKQLNAKTHQVKLAKEAFVKLLVDAFEGTEEATEEENSTEESAE
tara:strand:+ start:57 stop:329 length:273 start_codon:yes stop_codon:yes gene_type:complete